MASEQEKKIAILAAVVGGYSLFFDNDTNINNYIETDAMNPRKKIRRIEGYAENIVPLQNDGQFKSHFRVNRETFEILTIKINDWLCISKTHPICEPEKQLMITLWLLSTPESMRSVSDRFNVSKSTVWMSLMRVTSALKGLQEKEKIIAWPNDIQAKEISEAFYKKYKFPGVVGAIDGTHINIPAPTKAPGSYVNRKGNHSLVLQAVCDDKMVFTDIYVGEVGSVHDACIYHRSPIYCSTAFKFPNECHLIGDAAYPLEENMMTPFRNNGHLSQRQENYNRKLSAARCTIERAFAQLKGRFRRLKYLDMNRVDLMPIVIGACCILHNLCILSNDLIDECEDYVTEEYCHPIDEDINRRKSKAIEKRNAISECLLIS